MLPSSSNTIVALATPIGTGALAIIRLSGAHSQEIIQQCSHIKQLQARHATLCHIFDNKGRTIDEVILTYYAAPASFTGEDIIEICCHGGMLVVRRILERLIGCGARAAEAGEFSRRAFENGKLDLTQAEAVMDIISAGSDLALRAAQNQLGGAISKRVAEAVDALLHSLAHLEAYIDFPEEDISPDSQNTLLDGLNNIEAPLLALLATADEGRLLREGVRTAIIGAPNAGKSSLLNYLLGFDRAIVSEIAGTTRDTIEERINIGGLSLCLIDTAGIRESQDVIECAGIERSLKAGENADLIIEVVDGSHARIELPLKCSEKSKRILVLNKSDLPLHPDWQDNSEGLQLSCANETGRAALEAKIEELFLAGHAESDNLAAINLRHRQAIQEALVYLSATRESMLRGDSPELSAMELRDCWHSLSNITGSADCEDLLGRIFSQFCLGK